MKILYVSTVSITIHGFLIPHIEMLVNNGHKVDVACHIEAGVDDRLIHMGCRYFNLDFQRTPLNKKNLSACEELKKLIQEEQYDLVHTHSPIASACVRLACKNLSTVKVFYTAHGFHFYKGAPLKNWLLYYPIEKYFSRFTDLLITINKEDYERARKSFKAKNVLYVPGVGIDTDAIRETTVDIQAKKAQLQIPEGDLVIVSVGELNQNKNHSTIICAMAQLKEQNVTYVICGEGEFGVPLGRLIAHYKLQDKVKLLGRRNDVFEILQLADVFVHPSFREGLPVALLEAMASGRACVVSRIRGNVDLIKDREGGYICRPDDVYGFAAAIKNLLSDKQAAEMMGRHNQNAVKPYDIKEILTALDEIYKKYS